MEKMHRQWSGKSFLKHDHAKLVQIEHALFVSKPDWAAVGYVPVAIGLEYPHLAANSVKAEPVRW